MESNQIDVLLILFCVRLESSQLHDALILMSLIRNVQGVGESESQVVKVKKLSN